MKCSEIFFTKFTCTVTEKTGSLTLLNTIIHNIYMKLEYIFNFQGSNMTQSCVESSLRRIY